MNTRLKSLMILILACAVATGAYEGRQIGQWHRQAGSIRERQTSLLEQIRQLQAEQDEATNRMSKLMAQAGSGLGGDELSQLRAEMARLKAAAEVQTKNGQADPAVQAWLDRVNELKGYVSEHPEEFIPEFQYLKDREWLILAAHGRPGSDGRIALENLKGQAQTRFAQFMATVLQKYAAANNGRFPTDLSQLQPYCDTGVEDILQQRYEIKPASILPATMAGDQKIETDWVIAGKNTVSAGSADHIAIYTNGYTFFW